MEDLKEFYTISSHPDYQGIRHNPYDYTKPETYLLLFNPEYLFEHSGLIKLDLNYNNIELQQYLDHSVKNGSFSNMTGFIYHAGNANITGKLVFSDGVLTYESPNASFYERNFLTESFLYKHDADIIFYSPHVKVINIAGNIPQKRQYAYSILCRSILNSFDKIYMRKRYFASLSSEIELLE